MFDFIKNTVSNVANIANIIPQIGIKSIKYFVDSQIRDKVVPVEGSVLYCDLWVGAEHSGIYVGNNTIADIVVNSFMKGTVKASTPKTFVDQTTLGNKIYVSCNDDGAVGHRTVSNYAHGQVGKKSMYGLVFKNCHTFSERCVERLPDYQDNSLFQSAWNAVTNNLDDALDGTWESTIKSLKRTARDKLGAKKWRLWDWQNKDNHNNDADNQTLDWKAQEDYFKNMLLNQNSIQEIREQLQETSDYLTEIDNENIDKSIHEKIVQFKTTLKQVVDKHDEAKDFLALYPSSGFSYNTLTQSTDNLNALSDKMKNNPAIQALVKKMGRNYISEERKKAIKVPRMNQNEVYGTHNSDDIMRLLPNELLNLEDEVLETLFYARLLEKNLLTYQLKGVHWSDDETTEPIELRTGPIIACIDTSGSMSGEPLNTAKALLLSIANTLKQEKRDLHLILFGASGQIKEFSTQTGDDAFKLLDFLDQGFNGGTDFETPLKRAIQIIEEANNINNNNNGNNNNKNIYKKADVLMLSDGDCVISDAFKQTLTLKKTTLNCRVYSVLCAGQRAADSFSDEIIVCH